MDLNDFKRRLTSLLFIIAWWSRPALPQDAKPMPNVNDARLAGQIYSPSFCPGNPDVVAYERQEGDVQELMLYHFQTGEIQTIRATTSGASAKEDPFKSLFASQNLSDYSRFDGQLHWRPELDSYNRQWFVFVSTGGARSFDLYLSYVDHNGRLAEEPPLHLAHEGVDQYPKWSPDGNSLVFVSGGREGSDLFLAQDIDLVLNTDRLGLFQPFKITDNVEEDNYPVWSPDGKAIAYQSLRRDGNGPLNLGINVINVDEIKVNRAIRSIRLTAEAGSYHEYNPSWSAKGSTIAYYISQARVEQASSNRLLDIGVLTLVRSKADGPIESGRILQGTSQRLARNVVPNRHAGPAWGATAPNDPSADLIFFVKRDEKKLNPISTVNFSKWQNKNLDYEIPFAIFSTKLNRDVTLVHFKRDNNSGFRRFAYVAQVQTTNRLQVVDRPIETMPIPSYIALVTPKITIPTKTEMVANDPPPKKPDPEIKPKKPDPVMPPPSEPKQKATIPKINQPKSKNTAAALSIIPGLGQVYKGQVVKGFLFTIAEAAAVVFVLKSRQDFNDKKQQYVSNQVQPLYDKLPKARDQVYLAQGVAAGIWGLNMLDITLSGMPNPRPFRQIRLDKFGTVTLPAPNVRYDHGVWICAVSARLDF